MNSAAKCSLMLEEAAGEVTLFLIKIKEFTDYPFLRKLVSYRLK